MAHYRSLGAAFLAASAAALPGWASEERAPGAGNATAMKVAAGSPLVQASLGYLHERALAIRDPALREATLDATSNPATCVRHRARLSPADQKAILDRLLAEGLYAPADAAAFPGGAAAGVFPPVLYDGSACPRLPQPFGSAPGSVFGGHHSAPGGLALHEAFNEKSSESLAANYARNYQPLPHEKTPPRAPSGIDEDLVIAAPIWHDWAKTIVLQWNADGSEFPEFNFGGNGATDAFGQPGDSRTGGHHVLGVAEAMARGLAPAMVITQACAHSAPTLGNEFKVVNWLRAAAIIARVDPVARGYLRLDATGRPRLPPLRRLGDVNLQAADPAQVNVLPEYTIHHLSDADYVFTAPAVTQAEALLRRLAARYGYAPSDLARYNWSFRNTVLSHLSAERIAFAYERGGLEAVLEEVDALRVGKVL